MTFYMMIRILVMHILTNFGKVSIKNDKVVCVFSMLGCDLKVAILTISNFEVKYQDNWVTDHPNILHAQ